METEVNLHDAIAIIGKVRASYSDVVIAEIGRYAPDKKAEFIANRLRLDNALANLIGVVNYPEKV